MHWGWWIASTVSGTLLVAGSGFAFLQHRWLSRAAFTNGTVVELVRSTGKTLTYRPRVKFLDARGKSHTFDAIHSSNPAPYSVGDKVPVAYDNGASDASIATFGACFGLSVVMFSIGLAGAIMTVAFASGPRWVPAAYWPAWNG